MLGSSNTATLTEIACLKCSAACYGRVLPVRSKEKADLQDRWHIRTGLQEEVIARH